VRAEVAEGQTLAETPFAATLGLKKTLLAGGQKGQAGNGNHFGSTLALRCADIK
jgi:hypothetical protein